MATRTLTSVPGSPPAASEVRADSYWRILKKRKLLIAAVIALVTGGAFAWTLTRPRVYQAVATVVIEPQAPKVLADSPDIVELGASNYISNREYLNTQVRILKSRSLAREVVRKFPHTLTLPRIAATAKPGATDDELIENAADYLNLHIRVLPVKESRIFGIGFMDPDPVVAAALANEVTGVYIEQNRAVKVDVTRDANRWVAKQLDDARSELERAEGALYEYKKQNNMLSVNLEERQNLIAKALGDFSSAHTEARKKRIDLESHRVALAALIDADPTAAPSTYVAQSPTITALRSAYLEERRKLASLTEKYGSRWPEVMVQNSRTTATLDDLRNEARAMLKAVDAEIKSLVSAETRYNTEVERLTAEALDFNQKEIEYRRLHRAQANAEQGYVSLLKRLNESGLQERDFANNIRPLDTAEVPTEAAEPRVAQTVVFGFMIGVLVALALAFLLEVTDRTVKTVEDIEGDVGLPFLGMVPAIAQSEAVTAGGLRELHVMKHPASSAAECLRVVRTNVLFCSAARPLNRILVTSSKPLEGKTMTVVNLGVTMAQSGQRTLLIDTDMRRPRLHKILGVSNEHGLSRLILGEDDLDLAIKSTELPKLSILSCGPIPPNPAELLQTDRFVSLIRLLGERYDRLIFDSPPVLAVTDAAILSRLLDGVILVARAGRVHRDALIRARHHLHAVDAHVAGVVLNAVDLASPHYGEYYGYANKYYGREQPVSSTGAAAD